MSKIRDWDTDEKLILLEGWAREGLTESQIAKNIGISLKTLYNWKKKNLHILHALKKGKEVIDFEVENSLLKRALGYEYEECTYENGRLSKKVIKQVPADITAIIFWLKNRKPSKWRDKIVDSEDEEAIKNADEVLIKIRKSVNEGRDN